MLYTQEAVKANIRNREGKRVFFLGKGDTLTPGARDYLTRERIQILTTDQIPRCHRLACGATMAEKPEHMTHLNRETLVPKTHPRILFRGKMDSLEAELILCQLAVERLVKPVGEILAAARLLIRCDVLQQPVPEEKLCGLSPAEIRTRSHFPQDYYGQPHFMPTAADGAVIARLNKCRCAAREAELAAAAAFSDREGTPARLDILRAMNRISSALYLLMVQEKAGK